MQSHRAEGMRSVRCKIERCKSGYSCTDARRQEKANSRKARSVSVELDRTHGLLFTGDTYYPAPIWLYRPETNLDEYVASVKRLALLAPQLKLVLGEHNVPFAAPSVLPRLVVAIETVRAGKVPAEPQDAGKSIYRFDGFSFLLGAPALEK